MKALIAQSGQFGPFNSITTLADRYSCDGIDYPFSVIGAATIGDWVDPGPPPPPIPSSVSPRQIRQALTAVGLRANVEAAIAAADQDTKDWYEFATEFERSHPMVAALAGALNVTSAQLDDLWRLAGAL